MIARTAWLLMAFVKIMTKKKQQLNNIGFFFFFFFGHPLHILVGQSTKLLINSPLVDNANFAATLAVEKNEMTSDSFFLSFRWNLIWEEDFNRPARCRRGRARQVVVRGSGRGGR